MILPREMLEDRLPNVAMLHGSAPVGPYADLLADYFELLARRLPSLPASAGDDLARATCDILVACLSPSLANTEAARPQMGTLLARRAKQHIERNLSLPGLSPDSIAAGLGVSRRTLYRVFEPGGGIRKYIQSRRLDRVRGALADQGHRRKISEIAADYGFTRADYFARAFKRQFGLSPAEARRAVARKKAL